MNTNQPMTWQSFKAKLQENPNLHLQFQYAGGEKVNASYHITEIKQAPITSVDCGGKMNSWTEVIVQLWEPETLGDAREMTVAKALSIVAVVEKMLPLNPLALVKIEFGNNHFDTRQMLPQDFQIVNDNLLVSLVSDQVQCKAIERGGSCGTNAKGEECCTPAPAKQKLQLVNLGAAEAEVCTPGGGCC